MLSIIHCIVNYNHRIEQVLLSINTVLLLIITNYQIYSEQRKPNTAQKYRQNIVQKKDNNGTNILQSINGVTNAGLYLSVKLNFNSNYSYIQGGKVKFLLHRLNLVGAILYMVRCIDPSGIDSIYCCYMFYMRG